MNANDKVGSEKLGASGMYRKFDSHVHALGPKSDFVAMLDALGIEQVLNLSYSDFLEPDALLAYEEALLTGCDIFPGRFLFGPAFNVTRFRDANYVNEVIAKLQWDVVNNGAVAVKVWKDLGMMLKDDDDNFVHCDDPCFFPIFDFIQSKRLPVVMHIADPLEAWEPLDPSTPNHWYYKNHPDYHWYGKPGKPGHDEILAHRDALVARFPKIKFVGAHLGSMEHDVSVVARFLDSYPNAYVDTAARFPNLKVQPNDKVKEFFIRYQDRILYGTDWEWESISFGNTPEERQARIAASVKGFSENFAYLEQTLVLPPDVLNKFYYANAVGLFSKPAFA